MLYFLLGLLSGIILTTFYLIYKFKNSFKFINYRIDSIEQEMYDESNSIYNMVEKIVDDVNNNKNVIQDIDKDTNILASNQKLISDLILDKNNTKNNKSTKLTIDNVLDKISSEGLENLTDEERDILNNM